MEYRFKVGDYIIHRTPQEAVFTVAANFKALANDVLYVLAEGSEVGSGVPFLQFYDQNDVELFQGRVAIVSKASGRFIGKRHRHRGVELVENQTQISEECLFKDRIEAAKFLESQKQSQLFYETTVIHYDPAQKEMPL